jgi:nicotinate-nucleotide adenylyltransferase
MVDLTPYRRLILFGGSFDPPQLAHVVQPRYVMERIGADALLYMPAAISPHKLDRPPTPPQHRLAMLQLALADQPHAVVLPDELDRFAATGRPSYTVETIEALLPRLHADATLRLLIGGDQLRRFDTWRDHRRIAALADPVVMVRPPDTRDTLLASLPAGFERDEWAGRLVEIPQIEVSATDVRERVQGDRLYDHLVRPAVAAYIEQHGLYR